MQKHELRYDGFDHKYFISHLSFVFHFFSAIVKLCRGFFLWCPLHISFLRKEVREKSMTFKRIHFNTFSKDNIVFIFNQPTVREITIIVNYKKKFYEWPTVENTTSLHCISYIVYYTHSVLKHLVNYPVTSNQSKILRIVKTNHTVPYFTNRCSVFNVQCSQCSYVQCILCAMAKYNGANSYYYFIFFISFKAGLRGNVYSVQL